MVEAEGATFTTVSKVAVSDKRPLFFFSFKQNFVYSDLSIQVSFKASRELTSLSCFATNKVYSPLTNTFAGPGDGRQEAASPVAVHHGQCPLQARGPQHKAVSPIRGESPPKCCIKNWNTKNVLMPLNQRS